MTVRRVMVTGVGGPAGRSLAAQLLARGFEVVGTDVHPVIVPGVEVRVVPPASSPRLVPALIAEAEDNRVDLVVPTVSDELPAVARARALFPAPIEVLIGAPDAVALAHDKLSTARCLHDAGVGVPRSAVPSELGGLSSAHLLFRSPVVVKPRVSRGARGVSVLREGDDEAWAALDDSWLVQQFAPGTEYAPVVHLASPGSHGLDLVVVLEKTGLTRGEVGNATGVRRVSGPGADDAGAVALSAVRALGLTGPVDVDVRRLADGRPVVLEVNARFGANSAAAPELLDAVLGSLGQLADAA